MLPTETKRDLLDPANAGCTPRLATSTVERFNPLAFLNGDRRAADEGQPEPPKFQSERSPIVAKF